MTQETSPTKSRIYIITIITLSIAVAILSGSLFLMNSKDKQNNFSLTPDEKFLDSIMRKSGKSFIPPFRESEVTRTALSNIDSFRRYLFPEAKTTFVVYKAEHIIEYMTRKFPTLISRLKRTPDSTWRWDVGFYFAMKQDEADGQFKLSFYVIPTLTHNGIPFDYANDASKNQYGMDSREARNEDDTLAYNLGQRYPLVK